MTKIERLKQELTADPAGIGYAGMSDAEAAAAMNARTRQRKRDIPARDIIRYMVLADRWLPIKQAAPTDTNAEVAIDALKVFDEFSVADPDVGAQVEAKLAAVMDGLIASGLISDADKTAVMNLMWENVSRAEEIGLGTVTEAEVAQARRI